ncbi:carboxypeptidase regulatory-like domain-containing protein [Streptomyces sp. NBC_00433]
MFHRSKRRPARPARAVLALVAAVSAAAAGLLGVNTPQAQAVPASPAHGTAPQRTTQAKSPGDSVERVCGAPQPGQATCFAMRRTDTQDFRARAAADGQPDGLGATDIQSAYNLPADGGASQTVAIVDAYDDPTAESDLAIYRAQYGLPACTTDNGCFRKVDQRGGTVYPEPEESWAGEISLDLDMVSAAAPNAHILLIEADDPDPKNLAAAVNQAVAMGAKFISNSYGLDESLVDTALWDAAYNHPGVAVVAASGDESYGVQFPAASPYVTAVGGTSLVRDPGTVRGWSESAWNGGGSGCSTSEPKPDFQNDGGCAGRTVADVSAVADPETGAAVFQTYGKITDSGWEIIGGTSAATPIIAGVYAVAGAPEPDTYANSYPYVANRSALNDVTSGSNGECQPAYLCNAGAGYDGPTGLGTPNGPAAFKNGPYGRVHGKVLDAEKGTPVALAEVSAGGSTTYTGADGTFSLTLPAGKQSVTVGGYGFRTKTFAGVKIADKIVLERDFALTPLPSATVSGTVKDGSGHGWPLYARITVDGKPGAPIWTDPVTGAYRVTLPQQAAYTLRVTSYYQGYASAVSTVAVAADDVEADFALAADPRVGAAPGYSVTHDGSFESFESTASAPTGWAVQNAGGTTGGWQFNDPRYRGNKTGGAGGFAIADSGYGTTVDTSLLSPVYDFSQDGHPDLSFDTQYIGSFAQEASVDVSANGGKTWTTLWAPDPVFADVPGPATIRLDLTAYAGKPKVRLRFHFAGSDAWYWQIDDVQVADWKATPLPGALITGQVTDANTGEGITGSDVKDAAGDTAITTATPEDATTPDGFYWLFSQAGKQQVTAVRKPYQSATKNVKAVADRTTRVPDLALAAGRLSVTGGDISASVGWGASASQNLQVTNTGGAPVHVTLAERPAPAARPTPGSGWQPAADLPGPVIDGLAESYQGKLYAGLGGNGVGPSRKLMRYDPETGAWSTLASAQDTRTYPAHGFIGGKLYVTGGFGTSHQADPTLEVYDPATDTWTRGASMPTPLATAASTVLDGKLYVIGGCSSDYSCGENSTVSVYDPSTDSWSSAANYPVPVAAGACAGIENRIYCAGGTANPAVPGGTYDLSSAYSYDPVTDRWSKLPDMPHAVWRSAYTSADGLLLISGGQSKDAVLDSALAFDPRTSTWSSLPRMSQARTGAAGAPGFYTVGGIAEGASVQTVELLSGYNQQDGADITWMSASTPSLALQPGETAQVTVTLDASVAEIGQPGAYAARLQLNSDTPYPLADIPVSLTVSPPSSWGKITGKVTAASTGLPLAGATVEVDSWVADTTLTTAADGSYELWLDKRNNPLTVIVAKEGYKPVVATVKVVKGSVVVTDFALKKA